VINITELDPASGARASETNTLPYRNTTALIDDLRPGAKYRFVVQVGLRGTGGRPAVNTSQLRREPLARRRLGPLCVPCLPLGPH
jgi:hypothetical protein